MTTSTIDKLLAKAEWLDGRPLPRVRLTEAKFTRWSSDEDINAEWVDGEVTIMAPASGTHSDLNGWLYRLLCEFVEFHDLGIVRGPEFQIRLASVPSRRNPDVLFISNVKSSKLRENYLEGAPDLIIEVVSTDSEARDWRDKYLEYESSGVREYWVIDPSSKRLEAYTLGRTKKYARLEEDAEGRVHSKLLRGLYIRPTWLWRSPLPKLTPVLKELRLRS